MKNIYKRTNQIIVYVLCSLFVFLQSCGTLSNDRTRPLKRKREHSQGNTSSSYMKEAKFESKTEQIDFPELPAEMWDVIVSHLSVDDVERIIYTCKPFKDIIINHILERNMWVIEEESDFQRLTKESFSYFKWKYLVRNVYQLPQEFWPYIAKTQIHTLCLRDMHMGPEEINKLVPALANTQIKKLDLSFNPEIGVQGATKLAEILPSMPQLQVLMLAINSLQSEGASRIIEAFYNRNQFHTVTDHNIGSEGDRKLVKEFSDDSQPTELDLKGNFIGHDGITSLVEALRAVSRIDKLDLSSNQIRQEDFPQLFSALFDDTQRKLHTINLALNNAGDEEVLKLIEILAIGSRPRKLYLGYGISDDVQASIETSFPETKFHFTGKSLLPKFCRAGSKLG